jgi:hypothetical protein
MARGQAECRNIPLSSGSTSKNSLPRSTLSVRVRVTLRLTVSQSVSQSVSQYILVSSPLCGRLNKYCFPFKSLGLEFVVLSLWGALSDERPGLSLLLSPPLDTGEYLSGTKAVLLHTSHLHIFLTSFRGMHVLWNAINRTNTTILPTRGCC